MDDAMTKAPLGGEKVGKHPTDRGTIGTKHSIRTDSGGVPIGLAVDGANRHDCKLTRETIESMAVEWLDLTADAPQGMQARDSEGSFLHNPMDGLDKNPLLCTPPIRYRRTPQRSASPRRRGIVV